MPFWQDPVMVGGSILVLLSILMAAFLLYTEVRWN